MLLGQPPDHRIGSDSRYNRTARARILYTGQKSATAQEYVDQLRQVATTVVEIHTMHQKIVVIDERLVDHRVNDSDVVR